MDIDPTNNCIVDDAHVTLGWGRDFGDVTPMRGVILGGGTQSLAVRVTVTPRRRGPDRIAARMADRKFGIETLCLHAGQIPDAATGARAAPIYQTTSFVFDSAEHAASLFNLQTFGNVYSRISNPTMAVFEERMAAIEGGRSALACATGQAAEVTAILTLCSAGDHIVSASTLYGGTHTLLHVNLKKLGIETTFVDPTSRRISGRRSSKNTKLLYAETLGNPLINIVDIEALAKIAHEAEIPLVLDNTVPSPYLCRPIEWGADIVVHSATKYIGGHGTTMGGVIVESGKFNWGNGKFPEFTSALARLPRRHLPRDLRRLRLHHEGAHGDHAHLRPGALADQRLAAAAGAGVAARAHGAPLRERAGRREVPPGPSAGGVGELPRACRTASTTRWRRSTCPRAPRACSTSASRAARRRASASSRRRSS